MPLCVDDAATLASKNAVVEHLAECKDCEKFYHAMINELPIEDGEAEEKKEFVAIARKIRKRKLVVRTVITIVIVAAFEILLFYSEGYRITPESAAALSGKLNASSKEKCGIQLFPVIVKDPKVAVIEVSVFDQTKKIDVKTNELKILTFENKDTNRLNTITGNAYDKSGKLLYQLIYHEETMRQLWQKVNETMD